MRRRPPTVLAAAVLPVLSAILIAQQPAVDWAMVAKIREEGFQRSKVMDTLGYMTDVLGARLTLSQDMKRAQAWAKAEMERMGLTNVTIDPFMDYGVAWDNEYFSLHLLEPDYQPMVGFPLAHTRGTDGRMTLKVAVGDVARQEDLDQYRGKLKGLAVLSTLPAKVDVYAMKGAFERRTEAELHDLEAWIQPNLPVRQPPDPGLLTADQKLAFYKEEGVAAILECGSGWPGAVRGFARPGTRDDKWALEPSLAAPPIVAVTPEHYNRMYRILQRGVPVTIELEVRNRLGDTVEQAANILGEIPGTDLADEVVMLGAHFDTWHASPNASDNTSGSAVMLEAVRILKALKVQPRRTIRLALWTGEEQGLHGSREYVLKHFGNPKDEAVGVKPAYERFSVYFNQDYGAGQIRGIALQGNEHVRRTFAAWTEPFRDLGMTALSIQALGSTDHMSFDAVGLPGFQFIQDRIPGTGGHTNLDFFDTIQADDLMKNAVIVASFVYHAAMADERIPRKAME